jgi:hypothetical protein
MRLSPLFGVGATFDVNIFISNTNRLADALGRGLARL